MRLSVSVALTSPNELLARRIRAALERDDIDVVAKAENVEGLADEAAAANTIVLAGGTTATSRRALILGSRERFPGVPMVLVASLSANGARKAVDAGASGVVLEAAVEAALAETVRAVRAGQLVVPHRLGYAIRPPLSHREKQTLALVASGLTNREIAGRLYLAESTVKTHIASILAKLGVGSRAEATALVFDLDSNLGPSILPLAGLGDVPANAG